VLDIVRHDQRLTPQRHSAFGSLVEPLGEQWVAYSPRSGESHLLNDECAAILEVLAEAPGTPESVCETLRMDWQIDGPQVQDLVTGAWSTLLEAGLIYAVDPGPDVA